MKWLYSIVLIFLGAEHSNALGELSMTNAISSSVPVITDAVADVENVIKPEELLNIPLESLMGLEEELAFSTADRLCSMLLSAGLANSLIPPDIESMSLIWYRPCNKLRVNLADADTIIQSDDFDATLPAVVFLTGWLQDPNENYVENMADAFNCQGGFNFFVLDSAANLDTWYTFAATNTEPIGDALSFYFLEKLVNVKIYIIGHSLGAQIASNAGRYFTKRTGLQVEIIIGLDSAYPCFSNERLFPGLRSGDAALVLIIHTNPGGMGQADPLGDWDFYYEGMKTTKTGCTLFGCSHRFAYKLAITSVCPGYKQHFIGTRCDSLEDLKNSSCDGIEYPMGVLVDYGINNSASGIYFVPGNASSSYITPTCHCNKC